MGGTWNKGIKIGLLFFCWFVMEVALCFAQSAPARIIMDGSQTLYPLSRVVAQNFEKVKPEVKLVLNFSGSGPGFKKLCAGEIDVCNASRPIKALESELCAKQEVSYIELPVAYDAVVVVVNVRNEWADEISIAELKKIWEPAAQGQLTRWNQIRSDWPLRPLRLYGPAVESGTYDYFTAAILGLEGTSRGDFSSGTDLLSVVEGVSSDINALGFLPLSFCFSNQEKLKALPLVEGGGVVFPSVQAVRGGAYRLLSRPLFLYVSAKAARRPAVSSFVEYYLSNAGSLAADNGYVALEQAGYNAALKRFRAGISGTLFRDREAGVGLSMDDLLKIQG